MIIQEKSIPHIFRNKYLRDQGGAVMVGGSGGGTVTTIGGDYLPANLYESETYKVDYNTEFLKNLTVNGNTNLKNTNIDGDINITGKILVNGEEFKGGSGGDQETIDKIDEIEENLNILVDEYKKSGYRYSFSKANDNWLGFTVHVAFPEKQLWNYEYNWQIKGDVHIYTKDFNAIYYVYATGSLSETGVLTLSDSSCFAIGERRVPVVSVRLGGMSYTEDHPTNPAAHVGFTFRTPQFQDVVAFSHFDVTAYNPNNAGQDWIEYPASEVDHMPLLWDTDGTSTAPDPDKDYYIGYIVNDAFIPVVKMANSLSDLGITLTPDKFNILDGALITTEELNSLQGIKNNIQDTFDSFMIPFIARLNKVEGQLEDIELALDGILGYETSTYLEETLDEILYQ